MTASCRSSNPSQTLQPSSQYPLSGPVLCVGSITSTGKLGIRKPSLPVPLFTAHSHREDSIF